MQYLADTEEGGETVFPNIPAPGGSNGPGFSECARYHLAARPRKGDAILFRECALARFKHCIVVEFVKSHATQPVLRQDLLAAE
jgi:hypothetical protein